MEDSEGAIILATYYGCGHSEINQMAHGDHCPGERPQDYLGACPSIHGVILFQSYHAQCNRCHLVNRDTITWEEATEIINLHDAPSISHELDLEQIVPQETRETLLPRIRGSTDIINAAIARYFEQEEAAKEERILALPEEAGCTAVTSPVQDRCMICRELEEPGIGYSENDQPVITPCGPPGHEIGRRCLALWLDQGLDLEGCGRCPLCRKILIDRRDAN